jgi:uncharacterized lipoprotein YbaY
MKNLRVCGEIVFDPAPPSLSGATVYVRLRDTSLADAPSRVVAEQAMTRVEGLPPGGGELTFALPLESADARRTYTVSVHVDLDNDGRVGPGDFISTESYPVLTFGHPDRVRVRVRPVKGPG